jgi:hypothetical protein
MSAALVIPIPLTEEQPYVVHVGNSRGAACTFQLEWPPRTKCIPYAYLQCIDTYGERSAVLRYTFADVELTFGSDFPERRKLIEELSNFRVALIRGGTHTSMRILMEARSVKRELFSRHLDEL